MDKKISDINEMIDHNQEDDDVRDTNNHCSSNRSTPTSEKEKSHDDDDVVENENGAGESRDNGDRCGVKSTNVNNNSVSTRTMAEELALKDKEVRRRRCDRKISHKLFTCFVMSDVEPDDIQTVAIGMQLELWSLGAYLKLPVVEIYFSG